MKKKHLFPLLAALVCAAGLLWMRGGDRPALLDDPALPGGGASVPCAAGGRFHNVRFAERGVSFPGRAIHGGGERTG